MKELMICILAAGVAASDRASTITTIVTDAFKMYECINERLEKQQHKQSIELMQKLGLNADKND